jgi:hypothetical protein
MNVVATPEAKALIHQRGGRLFVWTDLPRCCGGATYLQSSFTLRAGRTFWRAGGFDDLELYIDLGRLSPPEELHLDVRGRRRKRVEAYWNGCVFVA